MRRTYTSLVTAALLLLGLVVLPMPGALAEPAECGDAIDNDADGYTDYPDDPGCQEVQDDSEAPSPECDDNFDNDADGNIDYPDDTGCASLEDDGECTGCTDGPMPECSDGLDNNQDGTTDYPADPGCGDAGDSSEGHGDPPCAFNGTNCNGMVLRYEEGSDRLVGAIGDRNDCMAYRSVLIKKKRDGRDLIVAHVQTDESGGWSRFVPSLWRGRYYSVAPRWKTTDSQSGAELTCIRRESRSVRIA